MLVNRICCVFFQAHASVNNIHLCLIFALSASFSVGVFHLLSLAFLPAIPVPLGRTGHDSPVWLPPILLDGAGQVALGGHTLWLAIIVIPLLAVSIFGRNVERNVPLKEPPVKRNELFKPEVCKPSDTGRVTFNQS